MYYLCKYFPNYFTFLIPFLIIMPLALSFARLPDRSYALSEEREPIVSEDVIFIPVGPSKPDVGNIISTHFTE